MYVSMLNINVFLLFAYIHMLIYSFINTYILTYIHTYTLSREWNFSRTIAK